MGGGTSGKEASTPWGWPAFGVRFWSAESYGFTCSLPYVLRLKSLGRYNVSAIKLTLESGNRIVLKLTDLKLGTPGITPAFGEGLAEAAGVCLEEREHSSPTAMQISGEAQGSATLEWEPTSAQMRRCWNDDEVATEHGAYGIATLLIPRITNLQIVERSKKGTGFDYWLGSATETATLFQNKARLEVSGIRTGPDATIVGRARKKLGQTEKSDAALSAVVIVVEFSGPQSRVAKRCPT